MIVEKLPFQHSFVTLFVEKHEKDRETQEGQKTSKLLEPKNHCVRIPHIKVEALQKHVLGHDLILGHL